MKTKFLCAVQMVPSCGLTIYFFAILFFLIKKNPRRGKKINKTIHRKLMCHPEEYLNSEYV